MDGERWNETFAGLSSLFNSLQEQIKPYTEMWKIVEQNIENVLSDYAEKTKPIRAFYIFGDYQFTYWKPLGCDEVDKILNFHDIDQYILEQIEDTEFIDYDTLCDEMMLSELLSATNKSILRQTVKAIEVGLYDLALAGVVIVFDGALTEATCNVSTNISKRIADVRKKIENLLDAEWECLEEKEITVVGMYITWIKTMERFQVYSKFDKPETERFESSLDCTWKKNYNGYELDCCKIINALYGLLYFGNPELLIS